ncbi:MAG: SDR family NAD(P)-dependent oxidoreductase [Paracoccaceae bacterium]
MKLSLSGKNAIVTGGSKGIGEAITVALAEAGAITYFTYNGSEEKAKLICEKPSILNKVRSFKVDVSKELEIINFFKELDKEDFQIDILINNAGILLEKKTIYTSSLEFDNLINVNLRGTFLTGKEALKRMILKKNQSRVINISSDLSFLGRESFSVYSASKAAINALTKSWSLEFAPKILVNGIAPGPIDTDMLDLKNMSPEWRKKEEMIPLERIGKPKEVASLAVYLSSEQSNFITGQIYGINGGSVMP